jgi:hypothetical protein
MNALIHEEVKLAIQNRYICIHSVHVPTTRDGWVGPRKTSLKTREGAYLVPRSVI